MLSSTILLLSSIHFILSYLQNVSRTSHEPLPLDPRELVLCFAQFSLHINKIENTYEYYYMFTVKPKFKGIGIWLTMD